MLPSPMGGSLQDGNCPEGEKVVYVEVVSARKGGSVKR